MYNGGMIDGEPVPISFEQEQAHTMFQRLIEQEFSYRNLSDDAKKIWNSDPVIQRELPIAAAKGYAELQNDKNYNFGGKLASLSAETMELFLNICASTEITQDEVDHPDLRKVIVAIAPQFLNNSTFADKVAEFNVSYKGKITSTLRYLDFNVDIDPTPNGNHYSVSDNKN